MGFFSSLFGSSDNSNSAPEIDINCYIATSCLKALGYTSQPENISQSVVGMAHSQNNNIGYTEKYFYEEAIYYIQTSLESEESYGVISKFQSLVSQDKSLAAHIDHNEILKCIKSTCITISKERVLATGLQITLTDSQISDLLDNRFLEYKDSHLNQMESEEPINNNGFSIGLSPRDHPLKVYLGCVADNMSSSLNISKDDAMSLTIIETALMASYTGSIQAVASIPSN